MKSGACYEEESRDRSGRPPSNVTMWNRMDPDTSKNVRPRRYGLPSVARELGWALVAP
jgi:hypothetical protein